MPEYIEEDQPLEERYTPAQPAFASTGMQICLRGNLFDGLQFEASNIVDDTTDEQMINERLDMMRRMFERQRMVFEHRMAKADLINKKVLLAELPGKITAYSQERAHALAVEHGKWAARWNRDRRGDFVPNQAQRQWLDQFEDESRKKLDEYEGMLQSYPGEIKNLEERLSRCQRVLDGEEKTQLLDDLLPEYRDAAE